MSIDAKEKIRASIDIAEVVSEVVSLQTAGKGQLKGLCPFHNEKTPSFHVNQDRGFYYCFGCGAKGDVFDFLMQTQGIDFGESLRILGQRTGIEVSPPSQIDLKKRDLYELNKIALKYFRDNLNDEIIGYLLNRKLSQESIDKFEIGFALDSWDSFLKYAIAKNISEQELVNAGLIRKNDNNRTYDYFRNRIMFPIKDYLGRVVGFSGRVIDESLPKYLNTNETSIFKKAELLYGLDTAKHAIRETKTAIVVEGFMDAIALQQTGFDNAVAALGANLSMQQAIALKRLDVNLVYLAFDADEAGQRAILSGLDQKIGNEFLIKAVSVPYGKDPADAVLEGSIEEFRKALENGLSEVEFRFKTVFGKYDNKTTEGKQKILNELLVSLQPKDVFDPVAAEMRRLVIDYLEIDGNRLDKFLNSKKQRKLNQTQIKGLETTKKSSQIAIFELEIMALVMLEPEQLEDNINTIQSSLPNEELSILSEFINICQISNYDDHAILEEYQNRDEGKILFERLFSQPNTEEYKIDVAKHLDNLLSSLRELYLNAEKEDVRAKLLARMAEVSQQLSSPELAAEELQSYYQELKLIQQMLAARDAERRLRHSPRQKN